MHPPPHPGGGVQSRGEGAKQRWCPCNGRGVLVVPGNFAAEGKGAWLVQGVRVPRAGEGCQAGGWTWWEGGGYLRKKGFVRARVTLSRKGDNPGREGTTLAREWVIREGKGGLPMQKEGYLSRGCGGGTRVEGVTLARGARCPQNAPSPSRRAALQRTPAAGKGLDRDGDGAGESRRPAAGTARPGAGGDSGGRLCPCAPPTPVRVSMQIAAIAEISGGWEGAGVQGSGGGEEREEDVCRIAPNFCKVPGAGSTRGRAGRGSARPSPHCEPSPGLGNTKRKPQIPPNLRKRPQQPT